MPNLHPLVRLVDDDDDYRSSQRLFLRMMGFEVADYPCALAFLEEETGERPGCILLDIRMPEIDGIEVQRRLSARGVRVPVIFLTGHGDVTTAVHTLKAGAVDFIEKRADPMALQAAVTSACRRSVEEARERLRLDEKAACYATLTNRERDVLALVARGLSNKEAGEVLGIGVETVKMHRANAFAKVGVQSALEAYRWLEDLARSDPVLKAALDCGAPGEGGAS